MGIEELIPDDVKADVVEKQYQQINICFDCSGYNLTCEMYFQQASLLKDGRECMQLGTIKNDLVKMKQGVNNITYPILKRIMEERGINYDG